MVDFILFTFWVATFAAGFWCGAKFGTVKAMASRATETVKAWL
jgi:hypothetical protein